MLLIPLTRFLVWDRGRFFHSVPDMQQTFDEAQTLKRNIQGYGVSEPSSLLQTTGRTWPHKENLRAQIRKNAPSPLPVWHPALIYLCQGFAIIETVETKPLNVKLQTGAGGGPGACFSNQGSSLRKSSFPKLRASHSTGTSITSARGQRRSPQNCCSGLGRGFWRKGQRGLCCP